MPDRLTPRGEPAPPVKPNIAQAAIPKQPVVKKQAVRVSDKPGLKYIRNIRGIQCRITLEAGKGRRVELSPRGQRGDVEIVNKTEQEDPIYIGNLGLLYEEITVAEAKKVIANQQVNASREHHPIFGQLLNSQGKPYEQTHATIEQSIEEQAIVVARVQQTGAGRFTDKNFEVTDATVSMRQAGPQYTEAPGSAGHPATQYMQSVPGDIDPTQYHEFLMWKQYQEMLNKQSAEEVRDSLKVTVEDTQTEEDQTPKMTKKQRDEYKKFLESQNDKS